MTYQLCEECGQKNDAGVFTSGCHGCDPDANIKLQLTPGHGEPAELCVVCGIRDGRGLPDSWRGRPICKPCGDAIDMSLTYMHIRCVDVAINAIVRTGENISKAISSRRAV